MTMPPCARRSSKSTESPAAPCEPHMSDYRVLAAAAMALLGALGAASEAAPADKTGSPAPLELLVLGSGGPAALGRASSSYIVLLDGVPRVPVDAGPGSF